MEWTLYIIGALAALTWKWQKYVYESKGRGISFKKSSMEWFEIHTFNSKVSWVMTVAVVWVIGGLYVNQSETVWLFGIDLSMIPQQSSIAFFLGVVAEMIAPEIGKMFMKKFADKVE